MSNASSLLNADAEMVDDANISPALYQEPRALKSY